jgi:hypothetical protein
MHRHEIVSTLLIHAEDSKRKLRGTKNRFPVANILGAQSSHCPLLDPGTFSRTQIDQPMRVRVPNNHLPADRGVP